MEENKNVEIPAKFAAIVKQIEEMSVLDLNELVKLFEVKFGVSAAAVAVAGPAAGPAAEEKTDFTVILTSDGGAKIPVMKEIKDALGLGLKEAKDVVDGAPSTVKTGVSKQEADDALKQLLEAGAEASNK